MWYTHKRVQDIYWRSAKYNVTNMICTTNKNTYYSCKLMQGNAQLKS